MPLYIACYKLCDTHLSILLILTFNFNFLIIIRLNLLNYIRFDVAELVIIRLICILLHNSKTYNTFFPLKLYTITFIIYSNLTTKILLSYFQCLTIFLVNNI